MCAYLLVLLRVRSRVLTPLAVPRSTSGSGNARGRKMIARGSADLGPPSPVKATTMMMGYVCWCDNTLTRRLTRRLPRTHTYTRSHTRRLVVVVSMRASYGPFSSPLLSSLTPSEKVAAPSSNITMGCAADESLIACLERVGRKDIPQALTLYASTLRSTSPPAPCRNSSLLPLPPRCTHRRRAAQPMWCLLSAPAQSSLTSCSCSRSCS